MHRMSVAMAVLTAAGVFTLGTPAATQQNELSAARVTHIGVVVPDIEAALQQYVRVMGFAPVKINTHAIPIPDGRKSEFKLATLYMPNFFIELNQPVNDVEPFSDHLKAHGMSIGHVGLALPGTGSVDELRAAAEAKGGKWTFGSKGGNYAYLNFYSTLGTTLEMIRPGAAQAPPPVPAGGGLPPLASLQVTHVGFAATDAAAAAKGFATLLGTTPPKIMDYKDAQYPPGSKWNTSAPLRIAAWNQGGIGLEIIESVGGPTPWSDYVKRQKGTAAQHLAINVGDRMDEMIADLVAKGGKWTNGKPGGNYAYLDFMDTLGLIFELNGTSKSAARK